MLAPLQEVVADQVEASCGPRTRSVCNQWAMVTEGYPRLYFLCPLLPDLAAHFCLYPLLFPCCALQFHYFLPPWMLLLNLLLLMLYLSNIREPPLPSLWLLISLFANLTLSVSI